MSNNSFKPEVQDIIDRLSKLDKKNPVYNKDIIAQCFREHMEKLNLPMLPIKYFDNCRDGYKYTIKAARSAAAWSAAWSAAARSAAWSAARSAAESAAAWSAARSAAWSAARSAAWSAARSAARSAAWSAAGSAAGSAAWSAAWLNCNRKDAIKCGGIWLPFLKASEAGLWLYWVTEKEIVCVLSPSLNIVNNKLHNSNGPAVSWPNGENYYFWKGFQCKEEYFTKPITIKIIDSEPNAEIRRCLVEKYGLANYIKDSKIKIFHKDDFGELYIKKQREDEDIYIVKVINSTPEGHWTGAEGWYKDGALITNAEQIEAIINDIENKGTLPDNIKYQYGNKFVPDLDENKDVIYKEYFLRVDPKAYGGLTTARAAVASTWRTKKGELYFKNPNDYAPIFES